MENNKNFTPFQIGFIIVFSVISIFIFLIPALTGNSTWIDIFGLVSIISLISAISGVFNSIYIARADIWCYFFWIVNTLTYAFVAYKSNLYGQVIQNLIFMFPLEIIGLISWIKALKKKKEVSKEEEGIDVKKFGLKEWIFTIIGLVIFWIAYCAFTYYLPNIMETLFKIKITPDPDFILDSLTAILTIYAVWLTGQRYLEQWTFWLLANAIGVIMFLIPTIQELSKGQFDVTTMSGALGWIQYFTSAIYGFICWRALYKKNQQKYK